jgi:CHASE3 domain sensor protein
MSFTIETRCLIETLITSISSHYLQSSEAKLLSLLWDKAAQFRETQDKLESLAVDYFVATDSIEDIDAAVEKEITVARERGKKQSAAAHEKAAAVIAAMLNLGTSRSEVAGRLGIATRDVKKAALATVVSSEPAAPADESSPANF